MTNPFEVILIKLDELGKKLETIDRKTKEEPERQYTVEEVARMIRVTPQTVRKKIREGQIKADTETKPFLISHSSIYTENNVLKKFKYTR